MSKAGTIAASIFPRIFRPEGVSAEPIPLTISGYPAELHIWSAEEWARLEHPPADAIARSDGTRAALRMA